MQQNDIWKGPNSYEKELTEETFNLCVKILVDLPFTKTKEETEPNMITVRRKNRITQHPWFQIWRETGEDNTYCAGHVYTNDLTTIKLNKRLYEGEYMIEMSQGVDSVNLDEHLL